MRKVANSLIIRLPQLFAPYQFGGGGKLLPQPRENRVSFLTGPFKGKVSHDRYFSQKSIKLHITYICTFLMCALDFLHLRIVYSCYFYEIRNQQILNILSMYTSHSSFLCQRLVSPIATIDITLSRASSPHAHVSIKLTGKSYY